MKLGKALETAARNGFADVVYVDPQAGLIIYEAHSAFIGADVTIEYRNSRAPVYLHSEDCPTIDRTTTCARALTELLRIGALPSAYIDGSTWRALHNPSARFAIECRTKRGAVARFPMVDYCNAYTSGMHGWRAAWLPDYESIDAWCESQNPIESIYKGGFAEHIHSALYEGREGLGGLIDRNAPDSDDIDPPTFGTWRLVRLPDES